MGLMVSPVRWSHFLISSGHVSRATRAGAMTSACRVWKRFRMSSLMAVRVEIVLPMPIPRRMAHCGLLMMNWVVWRW